MKALTLWPAYAMAIAAGIKRIETRCRPVHIRGPVAIHAGMHDTLLARGWFERALAESPEDAAAFSALGIYSYDDLPKGRIVAVAEIVTSTHCAILMTRGDVSAQEQRWGDFETADRDRWGWGLAHIRRCEIPTTIRGKQSFWPVPADLAAQLAA